MQGFLLDGGFRFRNLTFGTFGLLSGTCIGTDEQPFNELEPLCPEGFAFVTVLPGPIGRGACVSRSGSCVFGCILFLNRRFRFCLTCDPQVDNIGLLSVQPFGGSASGLVCGLPSPLSQQPGGIPLRRSTAPPNADNAHVADAELLGALAVMWHTQMWRWLRPPCADDPVGKLGRRP